MPYKLISLVFLLYFLIINKVNSQSDFILPVKKPSIFKNITGVKDATGDLRRVDAQLKAMGKEFIQLTGNDDNALEFNKKGGVGSISVTANIAAKLCSDFQMACMNDINKAAELDKILQPVHSSMFIESNPSPVKYAGSLLGMCRPEVRLPLVEVEEETKTKISDALKVAKLL